MKILILAILSLSCSVAQAQLPTNGLVAYFPFTGNAKDSGSNKTHGTATNVTLTTDRFGKANSAYLFNGSNSYIEFPSTYVKNNRYTYSLWAYLPDLPAAGDYTFALNIGSSGGDQNVNTSNFQSGAYNGWIGGGYNSISSNYTVSEKKSHTLNTWQHVLTVRDSNYVLLYINGVLVDSTGSSMNQQPFYGNGNVKAMIGIRQDLSRPFNGKLDEICIYNRALSRQEVKQLYNHQAKSSIIRHTFGQQNISLYPNIGTADFNVDLSGLRTASRQVRIKISNVLGQVVYEKIFPAEGQILEVNSGLNNGQYIVALYDDQDAFIASDKLQVRE